MSEHEVREVMTGGQGHVADELSDSRIDETERKLSGAEPFKNPGEALSWLSSVILFTFRKSRKEKALSRLRAVSGAVDSWVKCYRLASDTTELSTLKAELEELRTMVEAERGIRAVR